ncbi:hypothetical protein [Streptomyces mirabilis]|uniref:hypothetical protein n=1 Tax=Streptomyces mirabilis TaxID=68239 RepID=UPI0022593A42|nr:hypothetical protein [Streptomyces mirabilis]MCX4425851.1 hypothetical protein [Streptomyces mirabilis]
MRFCGLHGPAVDGELPYGKPINCRFLCTAADPIANDVGLPVWTTSNDYGHQEKRSSRHGLSVFDHTRGL